MSVVYTVDRDRGLVTVVADEHFTPSEMMGSLSALAVDHAAEGLDRLVILGEGSTCLFSQSVIGEMADRAQQVYGDEAQYRVAIVAGRLVNYGLSRMYALRSAVPPEKQRVFRCVREARSWLGR